MGMGAAGLSGARSSLVMAQRPSKRVPSSITSEGVLTSARSLPVGDLHFPLGLYVAAHVPGPPFREQLVEAHQLLSEW